MPPRRLYKYQAVTARTLENLKLRTLWFSAPSCFNDPFDCALQVAHADLSEADLDRALAYVRSHAPLAPSLEAQLTTSGRPSSTFRELMVRAVKDAFEQRRQVNLHERGVACFSAKKDDILMWAHYADGHRGFCLEFDMSGEPFSRAREVVYRADVPSINPLDVLEPGPKPDLVEAMMLTKSESWRYEAEWRVFHLEAGKAYTYAPALLTAVYLGTSMPEGQRDVVAHLLLGAPTHLYHMQPAADAFTVMAQPVTYTPFQY